MKKILLASTALFFSAGIAAAEVTVGGDARMGIIDNFDDDLAFISRIRISFAASGETDGGLSFGGSIRSDQSGQDDGGTDVNELMNGGTVFISGAFGKLSMGDVDGAAKAAVGFVSGVGLTGLSDLNETTYIADPGQTTAALYEYTTGGLTFYASASQPDGDNDTAEDAPASDQAFALAVKYAWGDYTVALGYEDMENIGSHVAIGGTAAFGDATVKAMYGNFDGDAGIADGDQYAISLDYVFGATTATAFYADDEELGGVQAYGIGASYDLGGGAALKGGYVKDDTNDIDGFDFGISMSF